MDVELADGFWAPRVAQLRDQTLPVILDRLERQGVVDNFRRLAHGTGEPRRAMHFSDSDLYKWLEAAVLAGRSDLVDPIIDLIEAVQQPDGYVHTHYGTADGPARYTDLDFGHEHYCTGHLIEAAIAHHRTTGSDQLLAVARRAADELTTTFGPGRDERTDGHPEVELALARLAGATSDDRYLDFAVWAVERRLAQVGATLEDLPLGGHAVKALYLATGIAEGARATGERRWIDAAVRLFDEMVGLHAYPTGAVGGRWLGESVGKPFEQPDAMAYAESCAAVAATRFSWAVWHLTGDARALDQVELLVHNAVPCGVGPGGDDWFYSQPHAVDAVAADPNPWVYDFDYGQLMLQEWFPARRHRWFLVPCCPPNLARLFAAVPGLVAKVDPAGDLLVHLPLAGRIRTGSWDVEITGAYADDGAIGVTVHSAPAGGTVRMRRPGWAGGAGHEPLPADGRVELPVDWEWWTTDDRVGGPTVHLRRGPVVHCVQGSDNPGVELADLVVDPTRPPADAFRLRNRPAAAGLHHRFVAGSDLAGDPVAVRTVPYADWAASGPTTMRLRFPIT